MSILKLECYELNSTNFACLYWVVWWSTEMWNSLLNHLGRT